MAQSSLLLSVEIVLQSLLQLWLLSTAKVNMSKQRGAVGGHTQGIEVRLETLFLSSANQPLDVPYREAL